MSNYSLDQFLEACGATTALRLTIESGGHPTEFVAPQPYALAGTDPRADLRLTDPRQPRRAAYLQILSGRLLCMNLAAAAIGRAGNFPPNEWLDPGRTWTCGSFTVRLDANSPATSPTSLPALRKDLPPAAVEITGGTGGACRYRIKRPLVLIGKSPQCQVRLRDARVSHFHCALVHTPAGLWAVDLLGRGGMTVNAATTRAVRLDDGDILRVGGFTFRPVLDRSAALESHSAGQASLQVPMATDLSTLPAPAAADFAGTGQPLVALFVALQQQMAEQFRLNMAGMLDTFRQMHDDQMRMVWSELAHIRQLNEEVASLKAAQARLPAAPPSTGTFPRVHPAAPAADRPPVNATAATSSAPSPLPPPRATGDGTIPQTGSNGPDPDGDVHAWVTRRVAAVQRERDGRWQKIVAFLTGSPT